MLNARRGKAVNSYQIHMFTPFHLLSTVRHGPSTEVLEKQPTPVSGKKRDSTEEVTRGLSKLSLVDDKDGKMELPVLQYVFDHVTAPGATAVTEKRLAVDILGLSGIVTKDVDMVIDETGNYLDIKVNLPVSPLFDPAEQTPQICRHGFGRVCVFASHRSS